MGLFDGIFGDKNKKEHKTESKIPWIGLTAREQLDEITDKSKERPQLIFKHSTTCGISRMVLNMFTSGYDLQEGLMDLYFLDLHAYREISNAIASKFQVMHQSPQLLIIKNGVVVAHDSHGGISEMELEKYI
ncbi:bacillithiol system redox-active protein YtxJ [Maribacter sp. 2304DJ31-5]|uniref:bacillithiol system redox-active protein YtxJ n=1 Tax=Maribacter sp. 2304DJ31-5 TaxID=3386273 RepID=UPI0039BC6EA0